MTVYTDLKLFRAMIKVVADSSDDPQTKIEAGIIDALLVERVAQLQKAGLESKQAESNGDDLAKFSKVVKTVKEWKQNSRGEWAWATMKGGEILPSLREVVQALRAAGRDGIVSDGYRYTVSDGRDGAVFLNRSRA